MVGMLSSRTNAPHIFKCGVTLYTAETHIIELIRENEGLSEVNLTQILGVTKDAVSQIIKKLEEKELIERTKALNEKGRLPLKLTTLGKQVFDEHREIHISYA
jgi:DNA-binding MarR family transcriptional regulator